LFREPDNLSDYIKACINRYKTKSNKVVFQGSEYELFRWSYHCYSFKKVIDCFYGEENVSKDLMCPLLENVSGSDYYFVLMDKDDRISRIVHEQFVIIQDDELIIKPVDKALIDVCDAYEKLQLRAFEWLKSGIESGEITGEDLRHWFH